jgi:hypothetical protein
MPKIGNLMDGNWRVTRDETGAAVPVQGPTGPSSPTREGAEPKIEPKKDARPTGG